MQLHLETNELNLLANRLMERKPPAVRLPLDDHLLEMVLARDLSFDSDDLQRLADLLAADEHCLKYDISREPDARRKAELQQKLAVLEGLLEKVDEACVMF